MKETFILIVFLCVTVICPTVHAQIAAPPGSGDKNLRDTNVKNRSVELERVDRERRKTNKSAANPAATAEDKLAAKYAEIKADYEQIQLSQDAIVKGYRGAGKIDYAEIGKSALEINERATRLNSNLFPAPPVENTQAEKEVKKEAKKTEKDLKPAKSIRDLIVELDEAIGIFATSSMFQNLRTVDVAVSAKAQLDLEKIIELSGLLNIEASKTATRKK